MVFFRCFPNSSDSINSNSFNSEVNMKLYGKNPVLERIKTNPKTIQRIIIAAGHPEHSYIALKAKKHGIAISVVPGTKILKLGRSNNTQGIIADVADFPYKNFDELLEESLEKNYTLFFLDQLTDPQNLGAIIRSLGCLGGFGIVLPTHDSVSVTEAVMRVASGGDNFVYVARVSNLNRAIDEAKSADFWIAGAVVEEGEDITQTKLQFPLGIVIGSEQKGIREIIRKRLDHFIRIPMAQPRMSLNVAQATTIFAYEIIKQQKT